MAPSLITKIKSFSQGFVVGCQQGELLFFSFNKQSKLFYHVKTWHCRDLSNHKILSLAFEEYSTDVVYMAVASANCSIVYLDIINGIYGQEAMIADSDEFINYSQVANGFHQDSVTTLQASLQRPLILTCSKIDC